MSVDAGGKVSVGGLDKTTDSGSLQSTFGQFGEVTEAVGTSAVSFEVHPRASSHSLTIYEHTAVMQDHNTGESRGFGFVTVSFRPFPYLFTPSSATWLQAFRQPNLTHPERPLAPRRRAHLCFGTAYACNNVSLESLSFISPSSSGEMSRAKEGPHGSPLFESFKQEADAHSAVQALDGQQLDGRKILVNFDRTQNGGGGGGGQRHGKNAFYDGYAYGEDGTADYGFGCQNQGNFNCPNDPGAEVVGSQITKNNVLGSEFD
ncbi:hypothetical protein PSHT_01241 [Puccinia striiformis]|uniref:RRM domain-containing protein n=1 Tax=Puccinia striiformis TaxID=27350 RepID=A0A2S4WL40_9BASI|nr:hypothetical protein PSHT_01241 [Puccinia striiformis]